MTNSNYIKKIYNESSEIYFSKRKTKEKSFFNDFLSDFQLKKHLKGIIKNKVTLDLGCGHGDFTNELYKLGAKIQGLDFSVKLINYARKNHSDITFYLSDVRKTPFKRNTFDIVVANLVIHYFKGLKPVFKEVSRILKPGGLFIFSMHHPVNEVFRKDKTNDDVKIILHPYFHKKKYIWRMENMTLISYHHTFSDISNNLKECSFYIDEIDESRPPRSSMKINKSDYNFSSKYPTFCIFVAVKK